MNIIETILKDKFEVHVDDDLGFDKRKLITAKKFLNFCYDQLGLKEKFNCFIVSNREEHGIKTTAFYLDNQTTQDGNHLIMVYGKDRMLGDIMRSIAHELTHQYQFENNKITYPVQDVGGEIEDEANAKAGAVVKAFIKGDEYGQYLFENFIL